LHFALAFSNESPKGKRGTHMADDKRKDQQQGGNQGGQDRQRPERKPGGGGSMDSPDSGRTRRQDEPEQQE
jgi:hypothetical protein